MTKNYFDKNYVDYWKKRVKNNTQGPKVPGKQTQSFFIKKLNISKNDLVLDLGCGHGALFDLFYGFSPNIVGIDINTNAVKEACKYPYRKVQKGSAEKTKLPKEMFDKIIAWAVYDVVEQSGALEEENRILKKGGQLLITGKNKNYLKNDREAFIAERNARLKDFPNHFTDVYALMNNSKRWGFEVLQAYGFPKRGDFAKKKYFNLLKNKKKHFYEFLVILKKISKPKSKNIDICSRYSNTATVMAEKFGFKNLPKFFKWHKQKYND